MTLVVRPQRSFLTTGLLAAQLGLTLRDYARNAGLGRDGTDHAAVVQQTALLIASASSQLEVRGMSMGFLAAQGALAYATSGCVKLISPLWRDGRAVTAVLRTESYGHEQLFAFLSSQPRIARLLSWMVIGSEVMAPVSLFLAQPAPRVVMIGLLAMHGGIAYFMGLNRFFWAFWAFHPPMAAVAAAVRRRP